MLLRGMKSAQALSSSTSCRSLGSRAWRGVAFHANWLRRTVHDYRLANNLNRLVFTKRLFNSSSPSLSASNGIISKSILDVLPITNIRDSLWSILKDEAASSPRRLVILDDDLTGCQAVSDIDLLLSYSVEDFKKQILKDDKPFFILTNTRSLSEIAAKERLEIILNNLNKAAFETEYLKSFQFISRSDSTLHGHFPAELEVLSEHVQTFCDGIVIAPAFFDGGRVTLNNTHYVIEGDDMIPVGNTHFAKDSQFRFQSSNLIDWVIEKSGGRIRRENCIPISINDIREGGPNRIADILNPGVMGKVFIVNAVNQHDLNIFALGAFQAEMNGVDLVYRTAASFVASRTGIQPRSLLTPMELSKDYIHDLRLYGDAAVARSNNHKYWDQISKDKRGASDNRKGLIVVGSYSSITTEQLDSLLEKANVVPIEVDVKAVLSISRRFSGNIEKVASSDEFKQLVTSYSSLIDRYLASPKSSNNNSIRKVSISKGVINQESTSIDHTNKQTLHGLTNIDTVDAAGGKAVVLYTSRELTDGTSLEDLALVSRTLTEIIQKITVPPDFLVAKGGITSYDIALNGLRATSATCLGQIEPGIPVWLPQSQLQPTQLSTGPIDAINKSEISTHPSALTYGDLRSRISGTAATSSLSFDQNAQSRGNKTYEGTKRNSILQYLFNASASLNNSNNSTFNFNNNELEKSDMPRHNPTLDGTSRLNALNSKKRSRKFSSKGTEYSMDLDSFDCNSNLFLDMPFIVFPGNVGSADTLLNVALKLGVARKSGLEQEITTSAEFESMTASSNDEDINSNSINSNDNSSNSNSNSDSSSGFDDDSNNINTASISPPSDGSESIDGMDIAIDGESVTSASFEDPLHSQSSISSTSLSPSGVWIDSSISLSDSYARQESLKLLEILNNFQKEGRAITSFNVYNLEGAKAAVSAAEKLDVPLILQLHPASLNYGGKPLLDLLASYRHYGNGKIFIACDRLQKESDIDFALQARIANLYMIDGSHLSFEENIKFTKQMASMCHDANGLVEGEIGFINENLSSIETNEKSIRITSALEALQFVNETNVDLLAVSIGNLAVIPDGSQLTLDLPRLESIHRTLSSEIGSGSFSRSIPLVLHDASTVPHGLITEAKRLGICKFNINADVRKAATDSITEYVNDCAKRSAEVDLPTLMMLSERSMEKEISKKMAMFNLATKPII